MSNAGLSLPSDWPRDPSTVQYARYLYAFFNGLLTTKPPPFEPIGSPGPVRGIEDNHCVANPHGGKRLMLNQLIVGMVMAGLVKTGSPQRGLLVYHGTGSGKTGSSVALMDAVWDLPSMRIVYASSIDALSSNPPDTFHKLAHKLLPRFAGVASLDEVKRQFERRGVTFLSFAQLSHQLMLAKELKTKTQAQRQEYEDYLKGGLLIIDEMHGIFKPLPNQKAEHDALRKFLLDMSNPHAAGMRLAILTATPGDNIPDILALLNMIRDPSSPPVQTPDVRDAKSMSTFKKRVQGLVSYLDMSSDPTRFPRLIESPVERLPMSMKQYVRYLDAWSEDQSSGRGTFDTTRKYSNMLYNFDNRLQVAEFSAKMPALLSNIQRYPLQKHYVYSMFSDRRGSSQGVRGIAHYLETELGYAKLSIDAATSPIDDAFFARLGKLPRYMLIVSTELSKTSATSKSDSALKRLLSIYNAPQNRYGEYVQILLASQNYFQAMDLSAVRHIHIFEPFLSYTSDVQALGRGRRYCSHKDLLFDKEWSVTVHRYLSDMPLQLSLAPEDAFKERMAQVSAKLEQARADLQALRRQPLKTSRDQEYLRLAESRVQDLQDQLSDAGWKDQARRLEMIDDIVVKDARARSAQLLGVLQALREAALDCRVFSAMHQIQCTE